MAHVQVRSQHTYTDSSDDIGIPLDGANTLSYTRSAAPSTWQQAQQLRLMQPLSCSLPPIMTHTHTHNSSNSNHQYCGTVGAALTLAACYSKASAHSAHLVQSDASLPGCSCKSCSDRLAGAGNGQHVYRTWCTEQQMCAPIKTTVTTPLQKVTINGCAP
jgi:hypothetical protein